MPVPVPVSLSDKVWLTKKELAAYLGLSQRFIDQHIRPFVPVYKPNPGWSTKILFKREDIDRFLETRRDQPVAVEAKP